MRRDRTNKTREDETKRQDNTRHDKRNQAKTRQNKARQDKTWHDKTKHDKKRQDMTKQHQTSQDKTHTAKNWPPDCQRDKVADEDGQNYGRADRQTAVYYFRLLQKTWNWISQATHIFRSSPPLALRAAAEGPQPFGGTLKEIFPIWYNWDPTIHSTITVTHGPRLT